VASLPAPKFQL